MRTKHVKNTWDQVAESYSIFVGPCRPSQDECRVYGTLIKKWLKNNNKPRILIMGSTPELRRMVYTLEFSFGAEVYCLDVSPDMYKAMSQFIMKFPGKREKFVTGSWLGTKFRDGFFDLVMGDEVICNIRSEKHQELFQEISRILKKDGLWITRHDVITKEMRKNNPHKILLELAKKVDSGEYDFQFAVCVLLQEAFFYSSSIGSPDKTGREFYAIIKNIHTHKFPSNNLKNIAESLLVILKKNIIDLTGNHIWCMFSKENSEKELKEFFSIEEEAYGADLPTSKSTPFYVLRKK